MMSSSRSKNVTITGLRASGTFATIVSCSLHQQCKLTLISLTEVFRIFKMRSRSRSMRTRNIYFFRSIKSYHGTRRKPQLTSHHSHFIDGLQLQRTAAGFLHRHDHSVLENRLGDPGEGAGLLLASGVHQVALPDFVQRHEARESRQVQHQALRAVARRYRNVHLVLGHRAKDDPWQSAWRRKVEPSFGADTRQTAMLWPGPTEELGT